MKPKITFSKGFMMLGSYVPPIATLTFPRTVFPFGLPQTMTTATFIERDEDYEKIAPTIDQILEVIKSYLEENLEVEEEEG